MDFFIIYSRKLFLGNKFGRTIRFKGGDMCKEDAISNQKKNSFIFKDVILVVIISKWWWWLIHCACIKSILKHLDLIILWMISNELLLRYVIGFLMPILSLVISFKIAFSLPSYIKFPDEIIFLRRHIWSNAVISIAGKLQ